MRDIDPQWYALRVVPQKEYVVGYLLRRSGMATFIPTEIRSHKRTSYAKGKADFAVPLIPGIVFAGFPSAPAWYDVLSNGLILGAIGADGVPWRLDFLRLLRFFSGVDDGCMVIDEDGLRLIHIPGRPPVRALTTRVRTISKRKREPEKPAADRNEMPVVKAPRKHVDFLSRFVHGGTA
jgi:hypothetical protein